MNDRTEPFAVDRRIEFRDTDAAGIVHFSAFFPMMEAAEHALLRHLGLSVMQPLEDGTHLSWPRVSAACDYAGAARFEDVIRIRPYVDKLGTKSVRYGFEMTRDAHPIATGTMTAVCCVLDAGGKLTSVSIPDRVRKLLESATQ
jgi:4-hydroxybenzoyl-CoA thioesterase/acyl-CoA thioester hydrolase